MYAAVDDGAGHRFFWRLSSKLSDQLPDHVQQVERIPQSGWGPLQLFELTGNGGRALHVPPVEPVGVSGTKLPLLSWRCPQSRERYPFVSLFIAR